MNQTIEGGEIEVRSCQTCQSCGRVKKEIAEAMEELVVIRCLTCGATVASGKIIALRAKCHRCGSFISIT